jgi:hypothetical protein
LKNFQSTPDISMTQRDVNTSEATFQTREIVLWVPLVTRDAIPLQRMLQSNRFSSQCYFCDQLEDILNDRSSARPVNSCRDLSLPLQVIYLTALRQKNHSFALTVLLKL